MVEKTISFSFNMTNNCNLHCDYCIQTVRNNKNKDFINIEDAIKYIDNFLNKHTEYTEIKIEFFGGEPTLKKKEILKVLSLIKNKEYLNKCNFSIVTNSLIPFTEYIDFMHNNNISSFKIVSSYDFCGQEKRSKNKIVNELIIKNILSYKELLIKYNYNFKNHLFISSCIVEKNINKLFDYFIEINFKYGLRLMEILPVFPEYWKYESFSKMTKQLDKIYNFILNNNYKDIEILKIKFPFKDVSLKHNNLIMGNDVEIFDKVEILGLDGVKNHYFFHKDRRGLNKKTYKIHKEIQNVMHKNFDITFDSFELNLLKKYTSKENIFNYITNKLLKGKNHKIFKLELYQLFYFNIFIVKKYIKVIKKIKGNIKINLLKDFFKNGIIYFLEQELNIDNVKLIKKILFDNLMVLDMNNFIMNDNKLNIIYDNNIDNLGYNIKNNIYINKKLHEEYNIDINDTILHEIMHIYLKKVGIDDILKSQKKQRLAELICENFISIYHNNVIKIK